MAISEWLKSFIENLRERIRNPFTERNTTPFAGTFLIALVIYNWKLFFSLLNFDKTETRLTKIEIISEFLKQESWLHRIIWPTAIAFGTILFYYIFNNISLGITTFFNRWFRAGILHLTDRGKNVPREEYESRSMKFNRLNKRFEDVNGAYIEALGEQERLKLQLTESNSRINEIRATNEKVFQERENLLKELEEKNSKLLNIQNVDKEILIVYAQYGKHDKYNDVTNILREALIKSKRITVNNETLGGNPVDGVHKELFIIYTFKSKIETFHSKEYYELEMFPEEGTFSNHETNESQLIYESNSGKYKLIDLLFPGEWQFIFKGKQNGITNVKLMNGNEYHISPNEEPRFYHYFNIENVTIDVETNKIFFRKVGVQNNKSIIECSLDIIEAGSHYKGTEDSGNVTVEYLRLK